MQTYMQVSTPTVTAARAPIAILGVPFDNLNLEETLSIAQEMIATGTPHYVTTVGVDFIAAAMDDLELRRILFDAHLVVAEDQTVVWASKILGNKLAENVTVPHLIPKLLTMAEQRNWRVFLLGGDDAVGVMMRARHPNLQLVVHSPPDQPLLEMNHAEIQTRLRSVKPHILLVALGSPKQEKWINMNYRDAGVPFVLGAGLTFDFLSGESQPTKRSRKSYSKFIRAILRQWWRLRTRKKGGAITDPNVVPDPYGNLVIHAPERLDAAAAQAGQVEWLHAIESGHVMFDLSNTVFADSTGVGAMIRLRRRARELGTQFILVAPRPSVEAALKLMKLNEFFSVQPSLAGARSAVESMAGMVPVSSGVQDAELQIRWTGEVTALNAIELGVFTESEMSQITPGMTVVIDLARVSFVDSSGIGLMVRFKRNLKRRDVNLRYANATASVRAVVRQTQLEEFLLA
jgi:exopolysaccharide biosynthesis WecB/TagA/CpsF family protein/anti-anti-sigma factor